MGRHASRDEMLQSFGPFAVAFEPVGNQTAPYLSLLNLYDDQGLARAVELIREAARERDSESFLVMLLRDRNWRPQLVGAVANLFLRSDSASSQMWRAVDAGSWVTPQLLAALSLVDSHFLERSLSRLDAACPIVEDPDYAVEDPIENHVARGPSASCGRSAKTASSLLALLEAVAADDRRIVDKRTNNDVLALVAEDIDESGDIAASWRDGISRFTHDL